MVIHSVMSFGVMNEIPKSPKSVRERQHKGKCPHKFDQGVILLLGLINIFAYMYS